MISTKTLAAAAASAAAAAEGGPASKEGGHGYSMEQVVEILRFAVSYNRVKQGAIEEDLKIKGDSKNSSTDFLPGRTFKTKKRLIETLSVSHSDQLRQCVVKNGLTPRPSAGGTREGTTQARNRKRQAEDLRVACVKNEDREGLVPGILKRSVRPISELSAALGPNGAPKSVRFSDPSTSSPAPSSFAIDAVPSQSPRAIAMRDGDTYQRLSAFFRLFEAGKHILEAEERLKAEREKASEAKDKFKQEYEGLYGRYPLHEDAPTEVKEMYVRCIMPGF